MDRDTTAFTVSTIHNNSEADAGNIFMSPIRPGEEDQMVTFPSRVKNGFISANEDVV